MNISPNSSVAEDSIEESQNAHVAVVGMAGRYPKSKNLDEFWEHLRSGTDFLESATNVELEELGIPPEIYTRKDYVRRGTRLPGHDSFDAKFFGFTPREAAGMDPQCRIFLETCYHACEDAGYDPFKFTVPVGVFAGSNPNDYASLLGVADPADSLSAFDQLIASDKDFLTTRVSHRLNLKGPSINIQTACSTSLVAVHMAVQSLLNYESGACLAGGVTVNLRQGPGYLYQDGMILSPEGKCRAFDHQASGTTLGQGCGVVLLKRLEDALADDDFVYAVIRGSAINNDGSDKLTYTAPSENGQAAVIATAMEIAGVDADSIGYVEAHGTGTKLGDPIEIAGLSRAFKRTTIRNGYCAIGSVKSNLGHTDAAAGITGFIKSVLCLHNKELVPSLHFDKPNADLNIHDSPFYVNTKNSEWLPDLLPRRAGVSAFGIGGTNCHVVLEEWDNSKKTGANFDLDETSFSHPVIVPMSARTKAALETNVENVRAKLDTLTSALIPTAAVTMQKGRPEFDHRAFMLSHQVSRTHGNVRQFSVPVLGVGPARKRKLLFMFSGQGSQYPQMCRQLYEEVLVFRTALDLSASLVKQHSGQDILEILFSDGSDYSQKLAQTEVTQPALFCIQYSLLELLHSFGLKPDAVLGHSIGEYAAAVAANVLSLEDAVIVVCERGRIMQSMLPGMMVSVDASAAELSADLPYGVSIAVKNSPKRTVVAGETSAVENFVEVLKSRGKSCQYLATSHAFHSPMMNEAAQIFERAIANISLKAPVLPIMSNLNGGWAENLDIVKPAYWADSIVSAVDFSGCISTAFKTDDYIFLEIGPGNSLSALVKANQISGDPAPAVVASVRHVKSDVSDCSFFYEAIGRLWTSGISLDWDKLNAPANLNGAVPRLPMPHYPFERVTHWAPQRRHVLSLPVLGEQPAPEELIPSKVLSRNPVNEWLYVPSWQRLSLPNESALESPTVVVVFLPRELENPLEFSSRMFPCTQPIVVLPEGRGFTQPSSRIYSVCPADETEMENLFASIVNEHGKIDHVVLGWLIKSEATILHESALEESLLEGVHTAHSCARQLAGLSGDGVIKLDFLTSGAHVVSGTERISPAATALLGPSKVIPLEYPNIKCRHVDLVAETRLGRQAEEIGLVLRSNLQFSVLALRHSFLWSYRVEQCGELPMLDGEVGRSSRIKRNGVYLIVGGLGGVGLSLAKHLAVNYQANIVLTSRSGRPSSDLDRDTESAKRIELLNDIEATAGSLAILKADVTSFASMEAVVDQTAKIGNGIDGVVVAAGVADTAGSIHRRTLDQADSAIHAKVHGATLLCKLLSSHRLDFLIFSSSIASMLYHNRFGQVGYVTANHYVEALSIAAREQGLPATTIAWDDWKNVGMSVKAAADFASKYGQDVKLVDEIHSFSPEEGVSCFYAALSCNEPLLYISTTDLNVRMNDDVNTKSPFLEQALSDENETVEISPNSSVDEIVRLSWSELLGYPEIADEDDFFTLGGDSLQAARLADKLSRALKIDVSLNFIFDNPVCLQLVRKLDQKTSENHVDTGDEIENESLMPLGTAQTRFMRRKTINPDYFNISVMLKSESRLSFENLNAVLSALVQRHASLRFRLTDDGTAQYSEPMDGESVLLERESVSSFNEEDTKDLFENLHNSLDLTSGPVFRALLLEDENGHQRLFLLMHHMVFDRVSLLIFLDGFNAAYANIEVDREIEFSRRTSSYAEWVTGQKDYVNNYNSVVLNLLKEDWSKVGRLPVNNESVQGENTNQSVDVVSVVVEKKILDKIQWVAENKLQELLLLVLGQAVCEWTNAEIALVESLGHGRRILSDIDVSRTTGFFLTYSPILLPARIGVDISKTIKGISYLLKNSWTIGAAGLWSHDAVVRNKVDQLPSAEILFNYVGREIAVDGSALLQLTSEYKGVDADPMGLRDHKLAILAKMLENDSVELTFVYSTSIHSKREIELLASKMLEYTLSFACDSTNINTH